MPERHHYAAWQDIVKINETTQDFFVFAKKGMSYGIPKRVFDSPEQAQAFLQAAKTYWDNAKLGLPLPFEEGVWPPAPNTGRRDENAQE